MSLGIYYYSVEGGRVPIPPRLRRSFSEGMEFLPLKEGCLVAVPSNNGRFLDSRGRITIPAKPRRRAQIGRVVVILASDHIIEFWGEKNWEREMDAVKAEVSKKQMKYLRNNGYFV